MITKKARTIKEEVWAHFKDFQYVFLATAEGNQPRVRPVTLIYFEGGKDSIFFPCNYKNLRYLGRLLFENAYPEKG